MRRWVALLLEGSRAVVSFGGCLSRPFAVRSGVAQGSPLSPLLYVAAAQPLAAALRRLVAAGRVAPIRLPGGAEAPVCHQHADDTSIHTATIEDAQTALAEAVEPYCRAAGAGLNLGKSEGLTLGAHAPIVGAHAPTGITFRSAAETIRHLGVMLTKGSRAAAAAQMWQKCVGSVAARVRHWSAIDLTLHGRVHVAKSVMASTIVHVASYVAAPEQQLRALAALVDGFALGKPLNPATDDRPARGRPPMAALHLPREEGGLGLPNVGHQATALLARTTARLLHPQHRVWKDLDRAQLERAFPGVGAAALVSRLRPGGARPALPRRLEAGWKALSATKPHRLTPTQDMLPHQVAREQLAGNANVAATAGEMAGLAWGRAERAWGPARRLGDLPWQAAGPPPATVPAEWERALRAPPPGTPWQASADGRWVRATGAGGRRRLFTVGAEGRLADAPGGGQHAAPADGWEDCCVVESPAERGATVRGAPALRPWLAPRAEDRPRDQTLYLVGPWRAVQVDPSLWGHGTTPLTHLTVRAATQRLARLAAAAALGGRYSPGEAVAPAIWGQRPDGAIDGAAVEELAQRQQQIFDEKTGARRAAGERGDLPPPAAQGRAPRWLSLLPPPARAHVSERVRSREAAAGLRQPTFQCDAADPLAKWGPGRPAWRAAWRVLQGRRPRPHHIFEWRLLHGGLPCGAVRVSHWASGAAGLAEAVCCSNVACRRPPTEGESDPRAWRLETVRHVLLDCPAVRPALQWLAGLWRRMEGGEGPPITSRVWLQGDPEAWQPQREHTELWHTLRIAMLAAAWHLRMERAARGTQFSPGELAARFSAAVHRLVRADWQRAVSDITDMAGTHRSWFPAADRRHAEYDMVAFEAEWCAAGVLAHVVHGQPGQRPRLEVRLDAPAEDDLAG